MEKSLTLADYEVAGGVALSDPPFSSFQRASRPGGRAGTAAAPVDADLEGAARGNAPEDRRTGGADADSASQRGRTGKPARRQRLRPAASWRRGSARGAALDDSEGREDVARALAASQGRVAHARAGARGGPQARHASRQRWRWVAPKASSSSRGKKQGCQKATTVVHLHPRLRQLEDRSET